MLKHMKMKAALSQQDETTEDGSTEEGFLQEEQVLAVDLNKLDDEPLENKDATNLIRSKNYQLEEDGLEAATSLFRANFETDPIRTREPTLHVGPSRHRSVSPPEMDKWGHFAGTHFGLRASPHGSEIMYNKNTCVDPRCHCSPKKPYPHYPHLEERCPCFNCQHAPKWVHPNSAPYFHASSHLPEHTGRMMYSTNHSFTNQKPLFPSPFSHDDVAWGRLPDSRFPDSRFPENGLNQASQHTYNNPYSFHHQPSFTEPTPSARFAQTLQTHSNDYSNPNNHTETFSLPLARSTIVSLVKSGKCDAILEALDGPLHDESSPLYTLALQSVLEILDVIEKDFSNAYQTNSKVESDIHQLSTFVKNMKKSTCRGIGLDEHPTTSQSVTPLTTTLAAQCPDISSLSSDASNVEASINQSYTASTEHETSPASFDNTAYRTKVGAKDDGRMVVLLDNPIDSNDNINQTKGAKKNVTSDVISKEIAHKLAEYKAEVLLPSLVLNNCESNASERKNGASVNDVGQIFEDVKEIATKVQNENSSHLKHQEIPCEGTKATEVEKASEVEKAPAGEESPAGQKAFAGGNCGTTQFDPKLEDKNSADLETVPDECKQEKGSEQKSNKKYTGITVDSNLNEPNDLETASSSKSADLNTKEDKILDVDVVDELLDETLFAAKSKFTKSSNSRPSDTSGGLGYRGKYKVRSVGSTDKTEVKPKAPVKTFAKLRENNLLKFNVDQNERLKGHSLESKENKDENGNLVIVPPSVPIKHANVHLSKESTPDIPRCPSNPLSPSCSDSLENVESMFEKSNTRVPDVSDSDQTVKADDCNTISTVQNINARKSTLSSGCGKPLIAKSFHGKLLIQRHSKEPPCNIPLEVPDDGCQLRDPRLALSNLMDHKVNAELGVFHWNNDEYNSKSGFVTRTLSVNARDPRIRRMMSEDKSIETNLSTNSKSQSGSLCPPKENKDILSNISSDEVASTSKRPTDCENSNDSENVTLVKTNHGDVGMKLHDHKKTVKSVITAVAFKQFYNNNTEKSKVAPNFRTLNDSIEKVDTVFSFQESLNVLKAIKVELKKELHNMDFKVENIRNDKVASLSDRVTVLKKAVEVSLLTTEIQTKKSTGNRKNVLCGVLEDHYILTADLIILGLWLKGGGPSKSSDDSLPNFREGVFSRDTAPSLRKIHKWLKNRYELDGFANERLSKLLSRIKNDTNQKRSRSRSLSAGSDRQMQTCDEQPKNSEKKSDIDGNKSLQKIPIKSKRSPSPKKKKDDVSDVELKSKQQNPPHCPSSGSETDSLKDSESDISLSTDSELGKSVEPRNCPSKKRKTNDKDDDDKGTKKQKQCVTVSSGIQDLPEEMKNIKKDVLDALSERNTKIANSCLKHLPEISRRAHAQLEDEHKTYMSMKNVSPETKAKFHDVVKGIQRLIVDCEILIYSLSWKANRAISRNAKDTIWTIAQKSSNKPSYEEELALLLSLRKSYLSSDLWRYIKVDVDDRIASLQKKCRSRDLGNQKSVMNTTDYDRNSTWSNAHTVQRYVGSVMQEPLPMHVLPAAPVQFEGAPDFRYNGPSERPFNYQSSHMQPVVRNEYIDLPPVQPYTPAGTIQYSMNEYSSHGSGQVRGPFQPHQTFLPRTEPPYYHWQRHDGYDDWDARSGKSSIGSLEYDTRSTYTPPMRL